MRGSFGEIYCNTVMVLEFSRKEVKPMNGIIGLIGLIILVVVGIWIWSLIDAIQNADNAILWVLVIFFLGVLGSILWWCIGERKKKGVAGAARRAVRGRQPANTAWQKKQYSPKSLRPGLSNRRKV